MDFLQTARGKGQSELSVCHTGGKGNFLPFTGRHFHSLDFYNSIDPDMAVISLRCGIFQFHRHIIICS